MYGKLSLQWDITEKGRVRKVGVIKSTIKNKPLESCLIRLFKRLRFPEPPSEADVRVVYPFVFMSK